MSVKLTLDDGTEYSAGEAIQYRINDKDWVDRNVCIKPFFLNSVSFQAIASSPHLFRKVPAPVEVPLTDADVLEMLREGGIEFKDKNGAWWSGYTYLIRENGKIFVCGISLLSYTHYRRRSENWVDRKMVKVV